MPNNAIYAAAAPVSRSWLPVFVGACLSACLALAACGKSDGNGPVNTSGGAGSGGKAAGAGGDTAGTAGGDRGGSGATAGTTGSAGTGTGGTAGSDVAGTVGTAGTAGDKGTGGAAKGGGGGAGSPGGGGKGGSGGGGGSGGLPNDAGTSGAADASARPARVLLYYFSTLDLGVTNQLASYKQKLESWQYQVDESKDPAVFTDANLAKYAAVGMINTCFYPFGDKKDGAAESQALQHFLQQGGGLFGTHCADVTFTTAKTMPLYNQLVGGWAHNGMNSGDSGNLTCTKAADHATSAMLPASFMYKGNVDVADVATDSTVLVKCKFGSTETPVSWVRTEMGAGRVFYTSFGKVDSDLTDATLGEKHIFAGLGWVLGR